MSRSTVLTAVLLGKWGVRIQGRARQGARDRWDSWEGSPEAGSLSDREVHHQNLVRNFKLGVAGGEIFGRRLFEPSEGESERTMSLMMSLRDDKTNTSRAAL